VGVGGRAVGPGGLLDSPDHVEDHLLGTTTGRYRSQGLASGRPLHAPRTTPSEVLIDDLGGIVDVLLGLAARPRNPRRPRLAGLLPHPERRPRRVVGVTELGRVVPRVGGAVDL